MRTNETALGWRQTRRALLPRLGAGLAGAALVAAVPARLARAGRQAEGRETEIDALLERLSPEQKVAQLFMIGVSGTSLAPAEAERLTRLQPGGVILLGANIGTASEVAAFVAAIHATNPTLPPLVAVDQEGGPVSRLAGDPAPGAVVLSQLPVAEVQALSRARAAYVASFGFDVNFAPVADVAFAPESSMASRSFGADPARVAIDVAAVVTGAAESGVLHAAKHFPGHGRTALDSHLTLPEVDISREVWRETDAIPFAAAIAAGVPLVMLGHLRYPQWDDAPTSISAVAIDALRQDLGFDGVIVTDDLGMAALGDLDPFTVVDRAIAAGVDLLLFATSSVPATELIAHLQRQVLAGALPIERIDASVRRIMRVGGRMQDTF